MSRSSPPTTVRNFAILLAMSTAALCSTRAFAAPSTTDSLTVHGTRPSAPSPTAEDTSDDDTSEMDEHPPVFATGVSGHAGTFLDGHTEQGVGVILRYAPWSWIGLTLNPSYVRATDTSRTTSVGVFNMSSLPVELSVSHPLAGDGSPDVSVSVDASFPMSMLSDSATRETTVGGSLGLGFSAGKSVQIDLDAWHQLYGSASGAAVARTSQTSLGAGISYAPMSHLTMNGSFSGDVGTADSAETLARSVGAGISYALLGPLTLTVDGSHRLAGDGPTWSLSVGIGTAFAGVASVGPASPLGRLAHAMQHVKAKVRGKK